MSHIIHDPNVCYECGGPMEMETYVHTEKVDDVVVKLPPFKTRQCRDCGEIHLQYDLLMALERQVLIKLLRSTITDPPGVAWGEGGLSPRLLRRARRTLGLRILDLPGAFEYETNKDARHCGACAALPHLRGCTCACPTCARANVEIPSAYAYVTDLIKRLENDRWIAV